jgi:ABC-type sugar transport system substrate-binding protein
MKRTRITVAAMALAAAGLVVAAGAASAAEPNHGGTNCHGVYVSYLATSGLSPGQLHKEYGASVQDVQAVADALCQ